LKKNSEFTGLDWTGQEKYADKRRTVEDGVFFAVRFEVT
jgi:hypothetical protein